MENNLMKAKYSEWQASLFGACGIALGLGALLASYIEPWALWLILLSTIMHAWGMFSIHKRNNT